MNKQKTTKLKKKSSKLLRYLVAKSGRNAVQVTMRPQKESQEVENGEQGAETMEGVCAGSIAQKSRPEIY